MTEISQEYIKNAKAADLKYFGVEQGPVSMRLASMPLTGMAFGMFGEASKSIHDTIQVMAESRVAQQNRAWARGEESDKGCLSVEVAYLRRRVSTASVTAFGQRLAGRMAQVGGQAAAQATNRRQQWGREEERARADREAAWLASTTGRNIVRKGRFWAC